MRKLKNHTWFFKFYRKIDLIPQIMLLRVNVPGLLHLQPFGYILTLERRRLECKN